LRGHCLCGEVRYEATGPPGEMWYCHCRACRKSSGVGFGTWLEAPGVRWLSGEERVARFAASPALARAFCTRCGSVLPALRSDAAQLPAGGLKELAGRRPLCHAFAAERVPWLPACGGELPCFAGPRGAGRPAPGALAAATASQRAAGAPTRGSCLCGAVAWAAAPPLYAMRVCHCSRCRRRSGSSWFVALGGDSSNLSYLRGEERTRGWHMPGTRFYTGRFCMRCGTPTPAVLRGTAFLSAGTLDEDPGVRLRCHIFYASRAAWVSVQDGLPRFEEFTPPDFDWRGGGPG